MGNVRYAMESVTLAQVTYFVVVVNWKIAIYFTDNYQDLFFLPKRRYIIVFQVSLSSR